MNFLHECHQIGLWVYSGRVTLHVNGKPVPPFTIGPNLKLYLNRGFLKADINSLRFDFGGKENLEVYEIRFDLPEDLVQKTKPSAPPPVKRIDATPPQDPVAAKVTEAPAAALAPAVAKKQESPPPPALEKPAPAPAIPAQSSGDPGQRWAVVIGVSAYEDSRVPSLRYASRDAQVFYDQNLTELGEGICVISASRDREFSQEGREWGGGHGVFSYYLIEGLKGAADFDKSGSVSVGEITVYVSQQVRRATRNAQNPIVAGRFDPSLVIGK